MTPAPRPATVARVACLYVSEMTTKSLQHDHSVFTHRKDASVLLWYNFPEPATVRNISTRGKATITHVLLQLRIRPSFL